MNPKKTLIEVALPLEAINREWAREESIRHRHASTPHLSWARRPDFGSTSVKYDFGELLGRAEEPV